MPTIVDVVHRISTGVARRLATRNKFLEFVPPGHFYSPVPALEEVQRRAAAIVDTSVASVPGIDTRDQAQLDLLRTCAPYYAEAPFPHVPRIGSRYHYENRFFCQGDGLALYGILRHFVPRRIVEVGSGFSSALMLDTMDHAPAPARCTFIEPYPKRLRSLLRDTDTHHLLIESPVQDVPLVLFDQLEANDILFIDSSHVVKIGSDVVHLLTYVLPRLQPGVLVHLHDVFWPFEYPESWVITEGRAWNEAYTLRAFLQFNRRFPILLFNSYLAARHLGAVRRWAPVALENPGGSLWLVTAGD